MDAYELALAVKAHARVLEGQIGENQGDRISNFSNIVDKMKALVDQMFDMVLVNDHEGLLVIQNTVNSALAFALAHTTPSVSSGTRVVNQSPMPTATHTPTTTATG